MILCIDSGNTRIKWAAHDGVKWLPGGAAARTELGALTALPGELPAPRRVMVANVAGAMAAEAIAQALLPWRESLVWVESLAQTCGVTNGYANPGRLGVDRWCALIGARHLIAGACVVVGAGTATTIDTLGGDGHFTGGLILPGFDLMRAALAHNTAALPHADGNYVLPPTSTEDAIFTGCLEAQLGAIERAWRRLDGAAECLLFGGAAPLLSMHLGIPHRLVDNLVLEGLRILAAESQQHG